MDIAMLMKVLGWCTVINWGILLLWFFAFVWAKDAFYRFHTQWFTLSKERFNEIHYTAMAYFKLTVMVFNLVPYLVLRFIIG